MDVCQMYGSDSIFLQQAAHLTGGSYIFLERRDALLQYLIVRVLVLLRHFLMMYQMAFLSPPAIRKILSVPTQDKIDFRAACFCHKNIVDIGFVCSVCLSSTSIPYSSIHTSSFISILSARPCLFDMQVD